MSRLLHISDTHFGTERSEVMSALYRLHRRLRCSIVVVSGDITQRATSAQFLKARDYIEGFDGAITLAVPGNHDIPLYALWERLLAPYRRYRRYFNAELEPTVDLDDWRIVGVNTSRKWRHKQGSISDEQIERVAETMQSARPEQRKVVVMHHPVAAVTPKDRDNLLRRRERALDQWKQVDVDVILGGHIHLPYVLPDATSAALHEKHLHQAQGQQPIVVQAGTATSRRLRGTNNSVNVLDSDPTKGLRVERWDYSPEHREFRQMVQSPQLAR